MTIGERIAQLIDRSGMSQADFARRVDVKPSTVSKWMASEWPPNADNMMAIASLFGMSLSGFLAGVDEVRSVGQE